LSRKPPQQIHKSRHPSFPRNMTLPTPEQLNFVNNYCAKLISRALTTNFIGIGRDDPLLIRILTSLTRSQAIGVDQYYRTLNTQNQSLPMKLESFGGSFGHFLSALTQSTESFHGSSLPSLIIHPISPSLSISHLWCIGWLINGCSIVE
jgi:hypothetical protein